MYFWVMRKGRFRSVKSPQKRVERKIVKTPASNFKFDYKFRLIHNGHMVYTVVNLKNSKPELRIKKFLSKNRIEFIPEAIIGKRNFRYDFLVPQKNILIEYDSAYYHNSPSSVINDANKTEYAKFLGITLHRLSDEDLPDLENVLSKILL